VFNSPAHHAQIIVKPFVGRAPWAHKPCTRRRLLVEARRVSLDAKERDEVRVFRYTERTRGPERSPQALREGRVCRKIRIVPHEILPYALDETFGINICEGRNLVGSQIKHADAPC